MAERDSLGRPLISLVRVIEYHGTAEWIEGVCRASRIPIQGVVRQKDNRPFPEGCEIKSGVVSWNIVDESGVEREVIPIPPPTSGTVQ